METNANRPYAHRHSWISSIPLRTQIFRSMVVGDLGSRLEIFKMASNSSDESNSEECGVHAADYVDENQSRSMNFYYNMFLFK